MRFRIVVMAVALAGCPPKQPVESAGSDAPVTTDTTPVEQADAPTTGKDDPLPERINEAVELIDKGGSANLERAVQLLEELAPQDTSGTARFNLGVAYQKRGDLNRAANQYQALLASNPAMGDAWLYLGSVQEEQGLLDAAVNNYRSGLRNDPENMGLWVALIASLRAQGKPDEAIRESKSALGVNANSMEVYNNFALAYLDKGDSTLARFILQKALQSIPNADDSAYLHTNLGWSFYRDGNIPAATQELERAVELDSELVPALVYLSRVYMDDKNYGDTISLLETAAKIDPNNADVQLTLGVAYRGVGRLADARKAYEKALVIQPGDPAPHFNLGVLLGDYEKDYDGAVAAFTQYIAAGGPERTKAEQYIQDVQKEKERAEKRASAEIEKKKRDEERKRKEELLRQAEEEEARRKEQEANSPPAPEETPEPAPEETTPEPAPEETPEAAPEETPEPAPEDAPEEGTEGAAPAESPEDGAGPPAPEQ